MNRLLTSKEIDSGLPGRWTWGRSGRQGGRGRRAGTLSRWCSLSAGTIGVGNGLVSFERVLIVGGNSLDRVFQWIVPPLMAFRARLLAYIIQFRSKND